MVKMTEKVIRQQSEFDDSVAVRNKNIVHLISPKSTGDQFATTRNTCHDNKPFFVRSGIKFPPTNQSAYSDWSEGK